MTQLGNSCSSRKRDWPLCSVAYFVGLALFVYHPVGCLTAETEGGKERTVTEAAWQKYRSNYQSRISEWPPQAKKVDTAIRYPKGKKQLPLESFRADPESTKHSPEQYAQKNGSGCALG